MEKFLSEAAQIFLKQFTEILNDFKKETELQVFLLNKDGDIINELEGVQPACKLILSTPEGKTRCKDCFKMGFSMIKMQKLPIFLECYAGFAIGWIPIVRANSLIGAVVICGARYDRGESEEKLREKFGNLAEELEIFDKENFFQKVKESKLINEEDFRKLAERLRKLIDILIENVQTPIKEIFG
jgi:ligand-binding sensor protein